MRTMIAMTGVTLVLGACAAYAGNGWDSPTEVGSIPIYSCPSHPQYEATWPALCPACRGTLQETGPSAGTILSTFLTADRDRREVREPQRQAAPEERREQQARIGDEARERQRQATAEERREQQARTGDEARERQRQATTEERREQQARTNTLNEEARERQRRTMTEEEQRRANALNEEARERQWNEESAERGYYPPDNRYYYPDQRYSYPEQRYGQAYSFPNGGRYDPRAGRSYYNSNTGYYFYPDTGFYFNPNTGQGYYAQDYNPTNVFPDNQGYYPPYGYTYPNEEAGERSAGERREEREERERD